jgi:DNA polymerase I-like protein with 3'-5' exonuclease and polymerase domains/uracil-DNA glycosylase
MADYNYYKLNRELERPTGPAPSQAPGLSQSLIQSKSTYLKPLGNPETAHYILVLGQPKTTDVLRGRALSSDTGQELESDLHAAGISPADCYITYVIKDLDRPASFYIQPKYRQKSIIGYEVQDEGKKYLSLLASELASCSAKVVVAFGDLPLYVLADRLSPYKWRGSVIPTTLLGGKTLVSTLDPGSVVYPQFQYKNKRLIIWDLIRARSIVSGDWKPKSRNIITSPSFSTCLNFLSTCFQYGRLGNIIWFDIETNVYNYEMMCISFAYNAENVISIPFIGPNGDYFTPPQEREILLRISDLLEDPKIPIGGQNLVFDCLYLLNKYGIKSSNVHDTMVAQKTLLPDYPVGLDFICSSYTDLPYYKDDGKYWLKGVGTFDQGWRYNALDSIVCAEAFDQQCEMLTKQGNFYTYERKAKTIIPYIYLMQHGIKINLDTMTADYNRQQNLATSVADTLADIAGQRLNPNSPKQVAEYFYDDKGLKAYKSKTGGRATDEKAMKRISRKGFKEAKLILEYRGLIKESSTFLNPEKVSADGRMRCSYNPVGTRFARASSSTNLFGEGNNLQNQPHDVLTHFVADDNYVFYGLDLSQAENRIVAYVGRISQMIEAFEQGKDIHGLTASLMASIFYAGSDRARSINVKVDKAPIGDGSKTWRDWGKKANHGLNYDLGYKTFALYNEIPEKDSKLIVNTYHKAYPGVREGFHAYVKACLQKSRTLTNLMGRKTFFADALNDETFKAGYSCIPQGSVGDIIDLRGINYCYYNRHPLFQFVELLIQVHDQIGFQVPTPYHPETPVSWHDHCRILEMVKSSLEFPLRTHYGHKFVIPVDITMGICLNKDFGYDFRRPSPALLESTYDRLLDEYRTRTHYFLEENK